MLDINAMLLCDTYKQCHNRMYDKGLTKLVSYWVPRKSMLGKNQKMIFFGLQAFIEEYLCQYFNKNFFNSNEYFSITDFKHYMTHHLGLKNYDIEPIDNLYNIGFLPIEIKSLPEGSKVNMGIPCIEVTNTHKDFAWVVQWIECIMQSEIWKSCNFATIGDMYYQIAKKYYEETTDGSDPRMACSDFGMRGMSCIEEALKCSSAWLLSFNKTSTIAVLPYINMLYDNNDNGNDIVNTNIGIGAVSTEHSVISANYAIDYERHKNDDDFNPKMVEGYFLKKMLTELYPDTSFSFLGDTYDYWNVIDNILPSCKNEIMGHNGKLLIRPDSGDIVEISVKTVEKLWNTFGGTLNSKGYKVLDPHIGIIYGDACTLVNVKKIWENLKELGFAANNIVFGVGAWCFYSMYDENDKLFFNTRDTMGCCQKSTYGIINNMELKIFKDPKTDVDNLKKSHKGLIFIEKEKNKYKATDNFIQSDYDEYSKTHKNEMILKYKNGVVYNKINFIDIRKRIENE